MTTFVEGAFDPAVLGGFGRRVIVRESTPGVSMVDVLDVDAALVAEVLRDAGATVLDGPPVVADDPPPVTAPAVPAPTPDAVWNPRVCNATACAATPCAADNDAVLYAVRAARDHVVNALTGVTDLPVAEMPDVYVDLTPVLDGLSALRADVELLERPGDVAAPVVAAVVTGWQRYAPWLGGAASALVVELVARLH